MTGFDKNTPVQGKETEKASDLDSNVAKSARTELLLITGSAGLRQETEGHGHGWDGAQFDTASAVKRLDARRRKDPHPASTAAPPAQGAGAVQQVDDVSAQEVQVGGVRGGVVTEGVSQAAFLHTHIHRRTKCV